MGSVLLGRSHGDDGWGVGVWRVRRIMRRPQGRMLCCWAWDFAVLANSRPFEGLVVSLPVAVVLYCLDAR